MITKSLVKQLISRRAYKLAAAGGILLSTAYMLSATPVSASPSPEIAPEVVSRVWLEDGVQVAAVTINGEEVARFKASDDNDDAIEEAENLAVKLSELVSDKKFDASSLLPTRDEDKVSIKHEGNTILTFDPFAGQVADENNSGKKTFETSMHLCNVIRTAFGANALPAGFPDITDKALAPRLDLLGHTFSGAASWYGGRFNGRRCSDGSRFSEERMTAAHRSLPFGTKLLVKNRRTGDTCIVEVNDRGPFIGNRVIDLSKAAAKQLNMVGSGIAMVDCQIIASGQ